MNINYIGFPPDGRQGLVPLWKNIRNYPSRCKKCNGNLHWNWCSTSGYQFACSISNKINPFF